MSVSTVQICSLNSKLARLRWRKYQNSLQSFQVIPSPEVLIIIPTAMFFTKNEIMPGRLVKAVSERAIRCCYSSHYSADEIIDFLSSLQFEKITPFVCPDKDSPLSSNTPHYEYRSEPLRQQRRFVEGGGFEEKDSEGTEKLIQLLNKV